MSPEIPELDQEDVYRPLEPHDKEVLNDKRFEKMDLRLHRIETMLQSVMLRLKKLVDIETKNIGKATADNKDKEKKRYGEKGGNIDEQMKFFERHEQRLIEHAKKLCEQEKDLQAVIESRREEDRWFNLIMHECGFKVSDRDTLICMKTDKPCNFRNCPRKDKIKEIIG